MANLTARQLTTVRKPGRYGDGDGLYLVVAPGGSKQWIMRFKRGGKTREMGLGRVRIGAGKKGMTLIEAREEARRIHAALREGRDPIAERRALRLQSSPMTFRAFAESYIADQEPGWKAKGKSAAQWRSSLKEYAYPTIGDLAPAAVTMAHVKRILDPIWQTKNTTADKLRQRIAVILDAAKALGLRHGDNPAAWRGGLKHLLPAPSKVHEAGHHAALPFVEVPAFMQALRGRPGVSPQALQFAILTAARTGEIIGARWDEVDLQAKLWTIPGERMKGGREHLVPLSDVVVTLLEDLPREEGNPHVFIGNRADGSMSNMAMLVLLRRMERTDITAHGFRSSFRDWAAETTSFPGEVVEMALAHAIPSKVEAAYRRGDLLDKRREVMEAWADFVGRRR